MEELSSQANISQVITCIDRDLGASSAEESGVGMWVKFITAAPKRRQRD